MLKMSNPMKLLLIDGNNLSHRVYWTHKDLSYEGTPVSVLYGFFRSLISFKKQFPDYFTVVVWDGGSKRRKEESEKAVEQGLIASSYKANRKREEIPEDLQSIFDQVDVLRKILLKVKVFQVSMKGYEADDIIHTYAKQNSGVGGKSVIVTSDHDFYQVLDANTIIYDAMKQETWTMELFESIYGFDPPLWVDVGAISGDISDNIHGVEGWGEKTAVKYVKEFGCVESVIEAIRGKKKRGKKEEKLLASIDIIQLAKSLKKMDIVPYVPRLRFTRKFDVEEIKKWFIATRFSSLLKDAWRLVDV